MTGFFFWVIYFPVLIILRTLLFWLPPLRKRISFEHKNFSDPGCRSFNDTLEAADLCFEFSSEGEYQQVASLIDDALRENKKIELVFFSPSVEKTIRELFEKNPANLRYLRYPMVTLTPGNSFTHWNTSKELILVRYDFLPEFLYWSHREGNVLKILWATFKKERSKELDPSVYKQLFFRRSSLTVFATEADQKQAQKLGFSGDVYDFRMEQIRRRCERRQEKFGTHFTDYPKFKSVLDQTPIEKRIIMGNAWPVDMDLLKSVSKDDLVVIVPHKLDKEILDQITAKLREIGRSPLMISDSWPGTGNTYILNKKGILCELYGDFGKAYVGGGFGVSVHSLLEPLVSGSALISCGPVHHRSTEFDLAGALGHLQEVKNSDDFRNWSLLSLPTMSSRDKMELTFQRYSKLKREVLLC